MKFVNVIDIETFTENNKFIPYCLCLLIKSKKIVFYGLNCVDNFLQWFDSNTVNEIVYAHNLSFDGTFIIEKLNPKKHKIEGHYFRNSIYSIDIQSLSSNSRITFKCSYKLFPAPLKKIGLLLSKDSEKLDFPHHFVNRKRIFYIGNHPVTNAPNWDLKKECIKYCIRDTLIVQKFIQKLLTNSQIKQVLPKIKSISALSLKIFDIFYNTKKVATNLDTKWDELIRKAYHGGRCEVFGNAKDDECVFHFDFSGMYSQVMLEKFCFGKISISYDTNAFNKPGYYEVTVLSKNMDIPILPYKDAASGKLIFPNGSWKGWYWWEELTYFLENGGTILKIHSAITFTEYDKIFDEYLEQFTILRQRSEFENKFWKLFINSLSGRFGMGPETEKTELIIDEEHYKKIEKNKIIKETWTNNVGLITWELNKIKSIINSNVSIAAAITAKARIKLHKAYKTTITNDGRVLYSDTDSVFAAFKKNVHNQTHDEITWTDKIDKSVFAIPKGYATVSNNIETIKLKGFQKKEISFQTFKNAFYNNLTLSDTQNQFQTSNLIPYLKTIEKDIKLNTYDKRHFSWDKTCTYPLTVIEEPK